MVQMKRIKLKLGLDPVKGKTSLELKREEKEIEALLTTEEWYKTFVTTCRGLFALGTSNYSAIVHLIYCACVARKFSGDLHKVCYSVVAYIYNFFLCLPL